MNRIRVVLLVVAVALPLVFGTSPPQAAPSGPTASVQSGCEQACTDVSPCVEDCEIAQDSCRSQCISILPACVDVCSISQRSCVVDCAAAESSCALDCGIDQPFCADTCSQLQAGCSQGCRLTEAPCSDVCVQATGCVTDCLRQQPWCPDECEASFDSCLNTCTLRQQLCQMDCGAVLRSCGTGCTISEPQCMEDCRSSIEGCQSSCTINERSCVAMCTKPLGVQVTASPNPAVAGDSVLVQATTTDENGMPKQFRFFDVEVVASGSRSGTLVDTIPLGPHGNGTYLGSWAPEGTGEYALSALIRDRSASGAKAKPTNGALVRVLARNAAVLELAGGPRGPFIIAPRDSLANPVGSTSPSDYSCSTDSQNVFFTGTLEVVNPYSFRTPVTATDYGTATATCSHGPTGAQGTGTVGFAPWDLVMHDSMGTPSRGFDPSSLFSTELVFLSLESMQFGQARVSLADATGATFMGCSAPAGFQAHCNFDPMSSSVQVGVFSPAPTTDPVSVTLTFGTIPTDQRVDGFFDVLDVHLFGPDGEIVYDPLLFVDPAWFRFSFAIKPTKTLNMHVYIVEGSATKEQVEQDIKEAEDSFAKNARACTCDFYVDFVPTFTTISAADWNKIDPDGDGLDRFDRNGDGDYSDAGDNNDLFNAMNLGYFDNGAATENIYYVPKIRGGLLGVTHAPNGQVAVDNSKDHDNLTLFHEKVHEMDLRKDGDFDVEDSPHDHGNAQGARNPGNGMNYDDTGRDLTRTQCEELDP